MSKGIPEPNRLIRCWGSDWSDFECIGKFIPFSPNARLGNGKPMDKARIARGRFFKQDKYGNFNVDRETWKCVERWEYIDEKAERGCENA